MTERRVVITADTDFPHLLALSWATTPGVVLFRGGTYTSPEMVDLLERVFVALPESILGHSICVVDKKRIRHRPLPLE